MDYVSKYATANVDKELYGQFKKACVASDMTILEAMNAMMTKFVEKRR